MDGKLRPKIKLIIILLTPIIIVLNSILKRYPEFVETYYSNRINRFTREVLNGFSGLFTFSIGEFLVGFLIILLIGSLIVLLVKIKKRTFSNHLISILAYLSTLYVLFMFLWGFNYNRLSFDKITGSKVEKASKQQLYDLCENLIQRANTLREVVHQNSEGVMEISGGYESVFQRAKEGYRKASLTISELGGSYGIPKPILLSEKMCYTGITGIYIPYTGEANVNINITDLMLPCTTAHEMAHQRGFSREDEANYIAYLTCSVHPDADFQYSGVMLALIYSMDALAQNDMKFFNVLKDKYSEGVKRDLQHERDFWVKYEGGIEKISREVNNTYLKSNGQKEGIESYGRMVDLLLADYKYK